MQSQECPAVNWFWAWFLHPYTEHLISEGLFVKPAVLLMEEDAVLFSRGGRTIPSEAPWASASFVKKHSNFHSHLLFSLWNLFIKSEPKDALWKPDQHRYANEGPWYLVIYWVSVIAWSPAVRVNPGSEQAKGKVITGLNKKKANKNINNILTKYLASCHPQESISCSTATHHCLWLKK